MENNNESNSEFFVVDEQAKSTFIEMSKWTKFLAVLGFIGLGLIIGAGVFMVIAMSGSSSTAMTNGMGGISIALMYLLFAGIFFYPLYTLLNYSTGIKEAFDTNNKNTFNKAVDNLKNTFKYLGIFHAVTLLIYVLLFIFRK